MTQLRKYRDSISNWFDEIERGIGKRGSTFTDVDAVSHDKDTKRFLFREFKTKGEKLDKAQRWVLSDLARLDRCTVWFVRKIDESTIGWAQFGSGKREMPLTIDQYRGLLHAWWNNRPIVAPSDITACAECGRDSCEGHELVPLTAADIPW